MLLPAAFAQGIRLGWELEVWMDEWVEAALPRVSTLQRPLSARRAAWARDIVPAHASAMRPTRPIRPVCPQSLPDATSLSPFTARCDQSVPIHRPMRPVCPHSLPDATSLSTFTVRCDESVHIHCPMRPVCPHSLPDTTSLSPFTARYDQSVSIHCPMRPDLQELVGQHIINREGAAQPVPMAIKSPNTITTPTPTHASFIIRVPACMPTGHHPCHPRRHRGRRRVPALQGHHPRRHKAS
eukprot:233271-Chlamydomonas_euryale.AAC.1